MRVDVDALDMCALLHVHVSVFGSSGLFFSVRSPSLPTQTSQRSPRLMKLQRSSRRRGKKKNPKGSPITYAATTPLFRHTHKHTPHEDLLIFNHAPICHEEKTRK